MPLEVSLFGGGGDDTFNMGTNTTRNVYLIGGLGADTFNGNFGSYYPNTVSYEYADAGVGVTYNGSAFAGFGWAGEATGDVMSGVFGFSGSAHADQFDLTMRQGAFGDIRAGAGDDVLNVWLSGSQTVYGNGIWHHSDTISDNDTITNTGTGGIIYGGAGNDIISGAGTLYGDAGADTITSANGNHHIFLGIDFDTDTFIYSGASGHDRVYDFSAEDVFRIDAGPAFDTLSEVLAVANETSTGVEFWFDSGCSVTLAGLSLASLSASNFEFF